MTAVDAARSADLSLIMLVCEIGFLLIVYYIVLKGDD